MLRTVIYIFSLVTLFLASETVCAETGRPTLLKKKPKQEKLREEVLITKEIDADKSYLKKHLNLDLVNKIFPSATDFKEIDKKTLSTEIYNNDNLIGYILKYIKFVCTNISSFEIYFS